MDYPEAVVVRGGRAASAAARVADWGETCGGRVHAGGCLESAAYNPTLGPVQTAIIAMVAAGGGPAGDVVAAALVEKDGAVVAQEAMARIFLAAVAPQASLHVYKYRSSDV